MRPIAEIASLIDRRTPHMIAQAYDLSDVMLADDGLRRIEWAADDMPVLQRLEARF